jgi:CDP-diglyceride synthetase
VIQRLKTLSASSSGVSLSDDLGRDLPKVSTGGKLKCLAFIVFLVSLFFSNPFIFRFRICFVLLLFYALISLLSFARNASESVCARHVGIRESSEAL